MITCLPVCLFVRLPVYLSAFFCSILKTDSNCLFTSCGCGKGFCLCSPEGRCGKGNFAGKGVNDDHGRAAADRNKDDYTVGARFRRFESEIIGVFAAGIFDFAHRLGDIIFFAGPKFDFLCGFSDLVYRSDFIVDLFGINGGNIFTGQPSITSFYAADTRGGRDGRCREGIGLCKG